MLIILFASCNRPSGSISMNELPPIYPDYTNIIIPYNIAPLNFQLRDSISDVEVTLTGENGKITINGGNKVQFPEDRWKKFLLAEQGNAVKVQVTAKAHGQWLKYSAFTWTIVPETIDPYLTYRLIEPGCEVWHRIQLCERHIESFSERVIADNNLIDRTCMNCHINGNNNPAWSFFQIRGDKGETILNQDGQLRKLNVQANYGNLHPGGRYGVFSSNDVQYELHTSGNEKLEVYDRSSDLLVLDFNQNKIITSRLVSGRTDMETFPVFSADGKSIYFCSAPALPVPDSLKLLKYSLLKIGFDAQTGQWGHRIDTLVNMTSESSGSVSFPRPSPDSRYILYSVSDYGTFPISHPETNLQLLNLRTNEIDSLVVLQSEYANTYHSWSSNSRWFVFASKRDDGLYGKPYIAYIDAEGTVHKPFVLPQKDPSFYDYNLRSFNIPELSKGKLPFNAIDIEDIYWNVEAEPFK